jgi:hypothetical protein
MLCALELTALKDEVVYVNLVTYFLSPFYIPVKDIVLERHNTKCAIFCLMYIYVYIYIYIYIYI